MDAYEDEFDAAAMQQLFALTEAAPIVPAAPPASADLFAGADLLTDEQLACAALEPVLSPPRPSPGKRGGRLRRTASGASAAGMGVFHPPIDPAQFALDVAAAKALASPAMHATVPMLSTLSDEQLVAALCDVSSPAMIIACAGAGKTRTIMARVGYLVNALGVPPSAIMCITFTRAAAQNMRTRLQAVIGPQAANSVNCSTYHSLAMRLCRRHLRDLDVGFDNNFNILTNAEAVRLLTEIVLEQVFHTSEATLAAQANGPAKAKAKDTRMRAKQQAYSLLEVWHASRTPGATAGHAASPAELVVLHTFTQTLQAQQLIDFTDVLLYALTILTRLPRAQALVASMAGYTLVDEFQDTSPLQLQLLYAIITCDQQLHGATDVSAAALPPRVTVVGDDSQAIYGFQGADPQAFAELHRRWPSTTRICVLSDSYRSCGHIVAASAGVIDAACQKIIPKRIGAVRAAGLPVTILEARNVECEVQYVLRVIRERMTSHSWSWRSFALLARTNKLVIAWAQILRKLDIPYIRAGSTIFRMREMYNVLALLRLVVSDDADDAAVMLLPRLAGRVSSTTMSALNHIQRGKGAVRVSFMAAVRHALAEFDAALVAAVPAAKPSKRRRGNTVGAVAVPAATAAATAAAVAAGRKRGRFDPSLLQDARDDHVETGVEGEDFGDLPMPTADAGSLRRFVSILDALRNRVVELSLPEFLNRALQRVPFTRREADRFDPMLEDDVAAMGGTQHPHAHGATSTSRAGGSSSSAAPGRAAAERMNLFAVLSDEAAQFARAFNDEATAEAAAVAAASTAAATTTSASRTRPVVDSAGRNRARLAAFVDHLITLATDGGAVDDQEADAGGAAALFRGRDAVWIGTIHQAKGLEWKCTFVTRMNDGVLPVLPETNEGDSMTMMDVLVAMFGEESGPQLDLAAQVEEERRVAYVAMTRAEEELHCCYVIRDEARLRAPSRFLSNIPPEHRRMLYMYNASEPPTDVHPQAVPTRTGSGSQSSKSSAPPVPDVAPI